MEHISLKARIRKHVWYYLTFIVLQLFGLALVLIFSGDRQLQFTFILVMTGIYISWSLLHQTIHHTLTAKVAAEYILIGLFGVSLTYFVL